MTTEQASREFFRLCKELGRDPKRLDEHRTKAWLRVLEGMHYERGRAAVTHLVDTWARDTFPPPGALTRAASEVSFEGQPSAAAYSQGPQSTWSKSDEAAFAFWRQRQIESFALPFPAPDEDPEDDEADRLEMRYWAYVNVREYRERCDAWFRQTWRKGAA